MEPLTKQETKNDFQIPSLDNLSLNSGQFHIPNLTFPSDGSTSLTALASEHLTHNPSSISLAPISDSGSSSLLEIANLHLSNSAKSSAFQIPSLFGAETVSIEAPELVVKDKEVNKEGSDIDLSLALNVAKPQKTLNKKQDTSQNTEQTLPKKSIESEILIAQDHWNKENLSLIQQKQSSTLGKVVCRRWRSKPRFSTQPYPQDFEPQIVAFSFDTASPDDIVRVAQGQAFTRPK